MYRPFQCPIPCIASVKNWFTTARMDKTIYEHAHNHEVRNRVILQLRPAAQEFLARRALVRETHAGEIIYEDGADFTHAVFPHSGVISLMAKLENGRSVEKASIGLEGFLGVALLTGGRKAISHSVVQVPGYASWICIDDVNEALVEFSCVKDAMLKYSKALIVQLMDSVACNSVHSAEQRVAKWLLLAQDRVGKNNIDITQGAIAEIFALRRQTVGSVYSLLQGRGIIECTRGTVVILDRQQLENVSCDCYNRWRGSSLIGVPVT